MRYLVPALLLAIAPVVMAQQPDTTTAALTPKKEAPLTPDELQRAAWKLTVEQYALVHPSRRPGGVMYNFHKQFQRGPHGNLMERIPGGPLRPVAL